VLLAWAWRSIRFGGLGGKSGARSSSVRLTSSGRQIERGESEAAGQRAYRRTVAQRILGRRMAMAG
jgi:hypothetical protein